MHSCNINQLAIHSFIKYLLTTYYVPLHPVLVENEGISKHKISKNGNEE